MESARSSGVADSRRTLRQRRGAAGEDAALAHLEALGWSVVARNVRVGARDEVDVVALTSDPVPMLVFVEVRTARDGRFGAPEERVDLGKLRSMYRAASALVRDGVLPDGRSVPRGPWRIDLVIVDDRHGDERGDEDRIRHLRAVA